MTGTRGGTAFGHYSSLHLNFLQTEGSPVSWSVSGSVRLGSGHECCVKGLYVTEEPTH